MSLTLIFSAPMVRALLAGRKNQTRFILAPGTSLFNGSPWSRTAKAQTWNWDDAWVDPGPSPAGNAGPYLKLPWLSGDNDGFQDTVHRVYPIWQPGDRAWCREAWRFDSMNDATSPSAFVRGLNEQGMSGPNGLVRFEADQRDAWGDEYTLPVGRLREARHLPRQLSRLTLVVTEVRVQRVQEISEADAIAEGCVARPFPGPWWQGYRRREDGELMHQQVVGDDPPAWMIEPHKMKHAAHLDRSARDDFRSVWMQINGAESWEANPWVWCVSFRRVTP